jgi:polyhydroxybutyrate depolymerase
VSVSSSSEQVMEDAWNRAVGLAGIDASRVHLLPIPGAVRRFVGCLLLGLCASFIALTAGSDPAAQAGGTQSGGTQAQPLASGLCAQAGKAHNVTIALQSEGQARSAVLHLPGAARGRALALLVAFHGWGSSGAQFERETGFDSLANRRGFAVLYPSSAGAHWQISGPRTDVTFITALLARAEAVACIDRRRVYATGLSNGAGMVARLACEASIQLAGAVPVAGYYSPLAPCEPMRAVSLLEIHGTNDTVVPYYDKGADGGSDALSFAAAWAARDGCADNPTIVAFAPHAALYRWNGCEDGVRVEQLTLYGVGHGLPDALGALVRAPGPATISGIGVVWSFLAPIVLAAPPA